MVAALLVLLLALRPALPLRSEEVFNTLAFDCTREKKLNTLTWTNTGIKLVRHAQLWMGMNKGTIADFGFMVVRDRDKTFFFRGNWDRYAETTGINDQIVEMDFAPDYILLLPGDTVTLYYHCQSFGEALGAGHVIVNLWFFP